MRLSNVLLQIVPQCTLIAAVWTLVGLGLLMHACDVVPEAVLRRARGAALWTRKKLGTLVKSPVMSEQVASLRELPAADVACMRSSLLVDGLHVPLMVSFKVGCIAALVTLIRLGPVAPVPTLCVLGQVLAGRRPVVALEAAVGRCLDWQMFLPHVAVKYGSVPNLERTKEALENVSIFVFPPVPIQGRPRGPGILAVDARKRFSVVYAMRPLKVGSYVHENVAAKGTFSGLRSHFVRNVDPVSGQRIDNLLMGVNIGKGKATRNVSF